MHSLSMARMAPGRIALALAATAVALAPATAAQEAGRRDDVRAFRDSVLAIRDTTQLRAIESSLMVEARRERSNAMLHLRLGVIAERLGAWRDAAAEYKWATDLEPRWPDAWLGWALAELRIGDEVETAPTNRRLRLARDAWGRSSQAAARAVELDPAMGDRVVEQVEAAVAAGRLDWARVLRDGLARAAGRRGVAGDVLMALGRADRARGDTAGAVLAFDAAAAIEGFRGRGLLERARTQLSAGDDRGISAYYAGAESADTAVITGYRRDLALIASSEELARFDAVDPEQRPAVLWDFWTGRDRDDLRRNGERLLEHFRRVATARREYGDLSDLRARVLIRHGAPDGRATLRHSAVPPNETWWYSPAGRPFVVHFVARSDSGTFELVESLFEIGASDGVGRVPGGGETASAGVDPELLLRSRGQLAPFYQAAVDADAGTRPEFRRRERLLGAAGRVAALTTDGYPVRFERELAVRVQVAGLAGGSAGPAIHLLYAIPGFAAEPQGGDGLVLYPTRLRVVVRDTAGAFVRAVDTVVVVEQPTPAADAERVGGGLSLPVPAGRYAVRVALQSGRAGTFVSRADVDVHPAAADRLLLSDLLLAGRGGAPLAVRLGGADVPVDPAPVLGRTDTLMVRAEVVGGHGDRGRLRALMRPRRSDDATPERWRPFPGFSDWVPIDLPPAGERGAIDLALPLRRLGTGAYELQLVAIDGSGVTAWRQAEFGVVER